MTTLIVIEYLELPNYLNVLTIFGIALIVGLVEDG